MNIREYALESLVKEREVVIYNTLIEAINKDIQRNSEYLIHAIKGYTVDEALCKKEASEIERYSKMAARVQRSLDDGEDISDILKQYSWTLNKLQNNNIEKEFEAVISGEDATRHCRI